MLFFIVSIIQFVYSNIHNINADLAFIYAFNGVCLALQYNLSVLLSDIFNLKLVINVEQKSIKREQQQYQQQLMMIMTLTDKHTTFVCTCPNFLRYLPKIDHSLRNTCNALKYSYFMHHNESLIHFDSLKVFNQLDNLFEPPKHVLFVSRINYFFWSHSLLNC